MLVKDKVIEILNKNLEARDNDNLLIAIYLEEVYGLTNTYDVALRINSNIYEGIRRTRQKVQQTNPLLRGKAVGYRRKKEIEVKEEVRGI